MKVLVIAENKQVIKEVFFCLQVRYPEVNIVSVAEGTKGVEMVETEWPDLVIVDSALSDIYNLDLITNIREFSEVALIVLYEGESEMDIARGLEAGADEYIIKPVTPIEFLARVRALLRRTQGLGFKAENLVSIGNKLSVNFATREVLVSGKRINLTPTEYHLLAELVRNQGRVLTHDILIKKVWGPEYDSDISFTKRYIYRLRKKLNDDPSNPQMIHTERGVGYKFLAPA